LKDRKRYLVHS